MLEKKCYTDIMNNSNNEDILFLFNNTKYYCDNIQLTHDCSIKLTCP